MHQSTSRHNEPPSFNKSCLDDLISSRLQLTVDPPVGFQKSVEKPGKTPPYPYLSPLLSSLHVPCLYVRSVLTSTEGKTEATEECMRQSRKKQRADASLAVAYLRVSTDEQTLGMEAQRSAIKTWAERQGITIARWCEDFGVSGGAELEKRPGLVEALAAVRELRAGVLVAHKADRIARDVYVSELVKRSLKGNGAGLALVEGICGDDPFSEMAGTVMDAAARLERRMIGARTKAALAEKRTKGQKTGGSVPYGFQLQADGIHLEPNPVEHPVLLRILELRLAGLGGRRIAAALTSEGHKPRGAAWNPGNLQTLADRLLAEGVELAS
jgi:DNA invertase Pin-like site-specific DNA recombinase